MHRILAAAGFGNVEMTPLDESLNLGSVDVAVHWLTRMGPAAAALQEAGEEQRTAAIAAMRAVFVESDTADGIIMPGAAWIVTGDAV